MALKFKVTIKDSSAKTLAEFETNAVHYQTFPDYAIDSEYTVGLLFAAITEKREASITVNPGNPDVVHLLLEYSKSRAPLTVKISLFRDATALESVTLYDAAVNLKTAERGAYAAFFQGKGAIGLADSADAGLIFDVLVFSPNDGKSDSTSWVAGRKWLANFQTDRVNLPPDDDTVQNEVSTARLFQAIAARKLLTVVVPGTGTSTVTHSFLEAQEDKRSLDVQISLFRKTKRTVRDGDKDIGGIKVPNYREVTDSNQLVELRLDKVEVSDYLPIKNNAYVAKLRVQGGPKVKVYP